MLTRVGLAGADPKYQCRWALIYHGHSSGRDRAHLGVNVIAEDGRVAHLPNDLCKLYRALRRREGKVKRRTQICFPVARVCTGRDRSAGVAGFVSLLAHFAGPAVPRHQ